MTRKKRDSLRFAWNFDREEFSWKLYLAGMRGDWRFLAEATEALKTKPRKRFSLTARVQAAHEDLYRRHGAKVTKKMIRMAVDPRIALRHYTRAFKAAKLSDLPKDIGGRPRGLNHSQKK